MPSPDVRFTRMWKKVRAYLRRMGGSGSACLLLLAALLLLIGLATICLRFIFHKSRSPNVSYGLFIITGGISGCHFPTTPRPHLTLMSLRVANNRLEQKGSLRKSIHIPSAEILPLCLVLLARGVYRPHRRQRVCLGCRRRRKVPSYCATTPSPV